MKKPIQVHVRDAENIIFEGEADRISSYNEMGRFDVFPMHANFISIAHKEIVLFHNNQKIKEIKIEQAILKVKNDVANIFLGVETLVVDEQSITTKGTKSEDVKK